MQNMKNFLWFKTIAIVLIMTFLLLDVAWAHPSDPVIQSQNLSGQAAFQQTMMTDQASRFQNTLFNDIKLLSAVESVAKYLFEEKEKGVEALTLERMEGVLSGQIDSEFLKGIDLSKASIKDGIALIHYKRDDKTYVIEVAQKDAVGADKLLGYDWNISDKYVAKVVPVNFKQELAGPAAVKAAPLPAPQTPVVAEPSKTPDTEPAKPKKDWISGIGRQTLIVYLLAGVFGLLGLNSSCRSGETGDPDKKPAEVSAEEKGVAVSVQGRKILVNKEAYTIKGMCWHPVLQGKDRRDGPDYIGSKADINLMAALGVNTIRVYQPIENKAVLDAIHEAGMKVIVGIPYFDDCKIPGPDIKTGSYKDHINKFKDHPAILMWELGNEFNYIFKDHPEWIKNDYPAWVGTGVQLWYKVLEDTAKAIHKIDNRHPVSTANGELPDLESLAKCPSVDVWGMNVYRWDNPDAIFKQWRDLGGQLKDKSRDKNIRTEIPMYFSEAGTDALDNKAFMVDEKAQAQAVVKIWMSVADNFDTTSGALFFAWRDELWKGKNPNMQTTQGFNHGGIPYDSFANEAWWGWADRFVSTVMKRIWKDGEKPKDILKDIKDGGKAPEPRRPTLRSIEPFSIAVIGSGILGILDWLGSLAIAYPWISVPIGIGITVVLSLKAWRLLSPLSWHLYWLKHAMNNEDHIEALVKIGSPAVPGLIEALSYNDYYVRVGAAKALGELKDLNAKEPLIKALSNTPSSSVGSIDACIALAGVLEKFGWKPAANTREEIFYAIAKSDVRGLIKALSNNGPYIRRKAAEALLRLNDKRFESINKYLAYIVRLDSDWYTALTPGQAEAILKCLDEGKDLNAVFIPPVTSKKVAYYPHWAAGLRWHKYTHADVPARIEIPSASRPEHENQQKPSGSTTLLSVEPFSVLLIASVLSGVLAAHPVFALIAAGVAAFIIYSKLKNRFSYKPALAVSGDMPMAMMSSNDEDLGGLDKGIAGPGIGPGGIPPVEIEKLREEGRNRKEEREERKEEVDQKVKKLFEFVESTVNNPRAQFVIDAKSLVTIMNAIPELEGKFADITFDKNMLTSQLKNNFKKLCARIDGLQETGLLTDDIVKKAHILETNIVKVEAASIVTSIIASARKIEEGQKLIIGLETGWIPGIDEKGYGTQHDAMNVLIREIEDIGASLKAAGINNVEIIHKDAGELQWAVLGRVDTTNMRMSNVIILGSSTTINSFIKSGSFSRINKSGDEERAFLAGIDPTELARAYADAKNDTNKIIDLSLIELISIAIELSLDKVPPKTPIIVSYDRRLRVVILLPRANIIDYNSMKHRYDAEKTALASA
jgi:hypothetical protein